MKRKITELDIRTHVRIHIGLLAAGGIVCVIGAKFSNPHHVHILLWLGLGIVLLSMARSVLFVKCPHCGSGLYNVRSLPEYCPDCGGKLVSLTRNAP